MWIVRPSQIDLSLKGKPKLRARLEVMAADAGVTGVEIEKTLRKAGIVVNMRSVWRWRARYLPMRFSVSRNVLARVIAEVLKMTPPQLRGLAKHLGVSLNK
jgi:hypothetical protein